MEAVMDTDGQSLNKKQKFMSWFYHQDSNWIILKSGSPFIPTTPTLPVQATFKDSNNTKFKVRLK